VGARVAAGRPGRPRRRVVWRADDGRRELAGRCSGCDRRDRDRASRGALVDAGNRLRAGVCMDECDDRSCNGCRWVARGEQGARARAHDVRCRRWFCVPRACRTGTHPLRWRFKFDRRRVVARAPSRDRRGRWAGARDLRVAPEPRPLQWAAGGDPLHDGGRARGARVVRACGQAHASGSRTARGRRRARRARAGGGGGRRGRVRGAPLQRRVAGTRLPDIARQRPVAGRACGSRVGPAHPLHGRHRDRARGPAYSADEGRGARSPLRCDGTTASRKLARACRGARRRREAVVPPAVDRAKAVRCGSFRKGLRESVAGRLRAARHLSRWHGAPCTRTGWKAARPALGCACGAVVAAPRRPAAAAAVTAWIGRRSGTRARAGSSRPRCRCHRRRARS
jgi:hypothetical protein